MRKTLSWLGLAVALTTLVGFGCSQKTATSATAPTVRAGAAAAPFTNATKPTGTLPPAAAAPATTHVVTIINYSFQPASITIKAGDTILWHQADTIPHSIVLSNGTTSFTIEKGQEYPFTFLVPGHYTYHCGIHPNMTGTVDVK